jgi:hypothetical protein
LAGSKDIDLSPTQFRSHHFDVTVSLSSPLTKFSSSLFSRAPSNKNQTPQPCPNGSFEMEVLTVQSGQFCEGDSGGSVIEEGLA